MSLINLMLEDREDIIPKHQTRNTTRDNPGHNKILFFEATDLLTGELQGSIQKVHKEIHLIVNDFYEALKVH